MIKKMLHKTISKLLFAVQLFMLTACGQKDEFVSISIGELRLDSKTSVVEFAVPKRNDEIMAISGELIEGGIDLESLTSSLQFSLQFIYEDGYRHSTGWIHPRIANWHDPSASLVISKEIAERAEAKIDRIRLFVKQKDVRLGSSLRIKIYSNYLE